MSVFCFGRTFTRAVGLFIALWITSFPEIAVAASTGQISGTVVDATTKAPLAGVSIAANSPSARYATRTDTSGRFTIVGVDLETYTLSAQLPGYDPFSLTGATVTADEAYRFDVQLSRPLRTIGRVVSRGRPTTSAFQPDQTVDRYTVNAQGIEQLLGKTFNTNGKELLSELPSVTIDRNGTALIRGGFSFQGGFQFEGIDYTEPSKNLTNRFENVGSNYLLNGVGSVEIIPGGGDATHGNTGTGLIAVTAKRGTFPGFGTIDFESGLVGSNLQQGFEYGFATPNQRLSNFLSYTAENTHYAYGPYGTDPASILADPTTQDPNLNSIYTSAQRRIYTTAFFNKSRQTSRDFLDNFVFKFGKNANQTLQFFVQSQNIHQDLDYGGYGLLTAIPQTIFFQNNTQLNPTGANFDSLTLLNAPPGFLQKFVTPTFGATSGSPLTSSETIDSPFSAYKIEYDNNIGASTSLGVRYYRTDNAATQVLPSQGIYTSASGGIRRGVTADITRVVGSKHTFQVGGKYEFVSPFGQRTNYIDYTGIYEGQYTNIGPQVVNLGSYTHDIIADYIRPVPGVNTLCLGYGPPSNPLVAPPQETCGYLYKYFKNGPPALPPETEVPTAKQQSYALYAQDTYAPSSKLRALIGLRLDGYNFLLPDDPQNPPAVNGIRHQRLYEPHLGLTYKLGVRDAVRANFGRTLIIPLATFIGTNISRADFAAFDNVPSFDSVTGKAASYCGPPSTKVLVGNAYVIGTQPCTSYADQLYWLVRNQRFADQNSITYPLRGSTFTNYDFSYSHEFKSGVALKVTPFYRVGYDVVETSQTLLGIDAITGTQQLSPQIQSNLGTQRATGVEFEATSPVRLSGLSGTFSATYINQIGNDPPGEYLPTASVQLGKLYRSPNLAPFQSTLALTYRSKWGLRVNPILNFASGYPYGAGTLAAFTLNGQPYYVPYTDALLANQYAAILSAATVNPQNPGSFTNPNLSALRGLDAATSGPGSFLSHPQLNTSLTVELTPTSGRKGLTYGIAIANLFDRVSSLPYANLSRNCVLIVTGLCGSDGRPSVVDTFHSGLTTVGSSSAAYAVYPNQPPTSVRAYIQAGL